MIFRGLNSKGDTIVEVLIAVAVLGMIIAGAYTVTNKSLQQIRQSQERNEAYNIAIANADRLNEAVAKDASLAGAAKPNIFCIKNDLTTASASTPSTTDLAVATSSSYNIACPSFGPSGRYRVYIDRDITPANNFTVYIVWDKVGGGTDRAQVSYRTK